jgi:hypothetical protein
VRKLLWRRKLQRQRAAELIWVIVSLAAST